MTSRNGKPRRKACRLEMPTGTPSPEALRDFALNCLVPMLADICLREWQAAQRETEIKSNIVTTNPLCRKGAEN